MTCRLLLASCLDLTNHLLNTNMASGKQPFKDYSDPYPSEETPQPSGSQPAKSKYVPLIDKYDEADRQIGVRNNRIAAFERKLEDYQEQNSRLSELEYSTEGDIKHVETNLRTLTRKMDAQRARIERERHGIEVLEKKKEDWHRLSEERLEETLKLLEELDWNSDDSAPADVKRIQRAGTSWLRESSSESDKDLNPKQGESSKGDHEALSPKQGESPKRNRKATVYREYDQ